ncbi:MAG: hypothetical protein U0232_15240 [Thermomicrobiales bacterium]
MADFARLQGPIVGLNRLTATHGTISPRDQRTVLVLSGEGIRPGTPDHPAAVIDIAPTILALLGLPPAGRRWSRAGGVVRQPRGCAARREQRADRGDGERPDAAAPGWGDGVSGYE